jgi:hypothetical protein
MRKKYLACAFVFLLVLLAAPQPSNAAGPTSGMEHNMKPLFDNLSNMTSQELVAELKYAVKMRNEGKYYPQDRIATIESQMAKNQQAEMKRYQDQLTKEAEVAKKIEDFKEKAIEKAKEKGEEYLDEHKEEIRKEVENQARKALGMSETDWIVNKEHINDMYEKGAEAYEEHAKSYVEVAQKAYDAYNAYQKAKTDHPEAPETAQNLVGFLNATSEVLGFAGDNMKDTTLRPIGEILTGYSEAAKLGDAAAKAAWDCIHKDGINPNFKNQYTDGLNQLPGNDGTQIDKTDLMRFNNDLRILSLSNGKYAAFDENFKLIPGQTGNELTAEEYTRLQQMYTAYETGKQNGWPVLTREQLVKLVRGEEIDVKTKDNWVRSDEFKKFNSESIMNLGHAKMNDMLEDELRRSVDRIVNGDQGVFDKLLDPFTRNGRTREINEAWSNYLNTQDSTVDKSDIHLREGFLEKVKQMMDAKPKPTMKDIIDKLKDEADKKKNGTTDKDKDKDKLSDKDKGKVSDKDKKNPLVDKLQKIKPGIKDADASGLKNKNAAAANGKDKHWSTRNPGEFNGSKDSGFANVGSTYKPIPDPYELGIPVLKPNIYLYPESAQNITVRFNQPERITTSIPEYLTGWSVSAEPDGKLDKQYGYLFYEANVREIFLQKSTGWQIPVIGRNKALTDILDLYGFNMIEKMDFIDFWIKKLDPSREYLAYPQETALVDCAMPVSVSPQPKNVYRIWFYFISVNNKSSAEIKNYPAEPSAVEKIKRDGYTLVEWGGMVR